MDNRSSPKLQDFHNYDRDRLRGPLIFWPNAANSHTGQKQKSQSAVLMVLEAYLGTLRKAYGNE